MPTAGPSVRARAVYLIPLDATPYASGEEGIWLKTDHTVHQTKADGTDIDLTNGSGASLGGDLSGSVTSAVITQITGPLTGNVAFARESDHSISIAASTTATTAGGALSLLAGNGNGAAGGNLVLDAGTGSVGGDVEIGTANAAQITLGGTSTPTVVLGYLSASLDLSFTNDTDHSIDVETSGAGLAGHNLSIQAGSGSGAAGGTLRLKAGTGTSDGDIEVGLLSTANLWLGASTTAIGFFGATPIALPSSTGETVGFTAGSGTTVTDQSTFTGNVGSTAYRMNDLVKHLKNLGLLTK